MSALNPGRSNSSNNGLNNAGRGHPAEDFAELDPFDTTYDYLDTLDPPAEAYERDLGECPILLTSLEREQAQRDLAFVETAGQERIDLLLDNLFQGKDPLRSCALYSRAIQPEMVEFGAQVLNLAGQGKFEITAVSLKNTVLLVDELRSYGELKLASRLNVMLTVEAQKANEVALHGHALLEVYDFFVERRQADLALPYLSQAIHLLHESEPELQIPALPRIQALLEQYQSGEMPEVHLSRHAVKFYKDTLDRILREAPDQLAPEVLDTRISKYQFALEQGKPSHAQLSEMEANLYPIAALLRDQSGFEDYYGEVLVVLGDVFKGLGNVSAAIESYLNAIEILSNGSGEVRGNRELHSVRGKALELMEETGDPRLSEQRRFYSTYTSE